MPNVAIPEIQNIPKKACLCNCNIVTIHYVLLRQSFSDKRLVFMKVILNVNNNILDLSGCRHCTKKWSFPLGISSVNVTKPGFLRIWSHLLRKTSFLCSEDFRVILFGYSYFDGTKSASVFNTTIVSTKVYCLDQRIQMSSYLLLISINTSLHS